MNRSLPLVSVVIPSYNSAAYVTQTIDSLLEDPYPNLEIIVVDDGSTDDTQARLASYAEQIVNLRKENGGLASARNFGMAAAKGEYIAWLDADDLNIPGRIGLQSEVLQRRDDVDLVCGAFEAFDENGELRETTLYTYYDRLGQSNGLQDFYSEKVPSFTDLKAASSDAAVGTVDLYVGRVWEHLVWGNFVHPPTIMVRRRAYERAGDLDGTIPTCEDWDYFTRIARTGKLACLDTPLIKYRLSVDQMSAAKNSSKIALNILRVFERTFTSNPELAQKHKDRVRSTLAGAHARMAYVNAEVDQPRALYHLFRGTVIDVGEMDFVRNLLRILTPNPVIRLARRLKNR